MFNHQVLYIENKTYRLRSSNLTVKSGHWRTGWPPPLSPKNACRPRCFSHRVSMVSTSYHSCRSDMDFCFEIYKAMLVGFESSAASMKPMLGDVFEPPQPEVFWPNGLQERKKCNSSSMYTSKTAYSKLNTDGLLMRMKIMLRVVSMRQFPVLALRQMRPLT